MSLVIKPLDPARDEAAFSAFAAEAYGPKSFLRQPNYVRWWFGSSPYRVGADSSDVLVAWHNDRIVGMNGHIAHPITHRGESFTLHWAANTMVLPQYRRGLGPRLLAESVQRFENYGSISFGEPSRRMLEHLGFELFGCRSMARAIAITDPVRFAQLPTVAGEALERVRNTHAFELPPAGPTRLLARDELQAAASLWSAVQPRYGIATNRSSDFLDWRYFQHPVGKYRLVCLDEPPLQAVAITRADGSNPTAIRIIDLWGTAAGVVPLLTSLCDEARDRHAFVDFLCTHTPDREAFQAAGFAWLDTPEDAGAIPFLMNPVVLRPYHEQLALKFSHGQNGTAYEQTYFTRGDGDRDRPPAN